ncbi:MAG: hypothetical protein J6M64_01480 [Oscillospiraceae bacterium]|nr:hypothetical protein [Oscillospiraceae bacterium]
MEEYSSDNLREDELNKKKELLQREIVDGNYNKDQFIDYCLALKPYGDDLSQWSYEELKSAVNSFITYHQQEDLREKHEQQMKNQIQDQANQMQNQITGVAASPKTGETAPVAVLFAVASLGAAVACSRKARYNK